MHITKETPGTMARPARRCLVHCWLHVVPSCYRHCRCRAGAAGLQVTTDGKPKVRTAAWAVGL